MSLSINYATKKQIANNKSPASLDVIKNSGIKNQKLSSISQSIDDIHYRKQSNYSHFIPNLTSSNNVNQGVERLCAVIVNNELSYESFLNHEELPQLKSFFNELLTVLSSNIELLQSNSSKLNNAIGDQSFNQLSILLIEIFTKIAQTLGSQADFKSTLQEIINNINTVMTELTTEIQDALKVAQEELKNQIMDKIKHAAMTGILMSIGIAVISAALIIGGAISGNVSLVVAGSIMLLNSCAQLVANISLYNNPEHSLKNDSWERSLIHNGIFGLADVAGLKNGGTIFETAITVLLLVATDGASIVNTVEERAMLKLYQIALRILAYLDNLSQVVGMVGSLVDQKQEIFGKLSAGSVALALDEIIKKTGIDQTMWWVMLLKVTTTMAAQCGMQAMTSAGSKSITDLERDVKQAEINLRSGVSNAAEALEKANKALEMATVEKTFGSFLNKFRRRVSDVSMANRVKSISDNINNIFLTNIHNMNTKYAADAELKKSLFNITLDQLRQILSITMATNERALQSEQKTTEMLKDVEATFKRIFSNNQR